jgi:hypothetical protein
VPIEIPVGFCPFGGVAFAQIFGLTVGKAIALRALFALLASGAFAGGAKIDQFGHFWLR